LTVAAACGNKKSLEAAAARRALRPKVFPSPGDERRVATVTITRVGTNAKYSDGWEAAFAGKRGGAAKAKKSGSAAAKKKSPKKAGRKSK
jgi:hypothetical protein